MKSRQEHWFDRNRDSQRFINQCVICGKQGYAPQIEDADFAKKGWGFSRYFGRAAIRARLVKSFEPLLLDESGRCKACAQEESKPKV